MTTQENSSGTEVFDRIISIMETVSKKPYASKFWTVTSSFFLMPENRMTHRISFSDGRISRSMIMDILAGTWYAQYLEVKYGDSIDSFVSVMDEFHAGINAVLEKATHENWEQVVVSINESISLFFYQITKNNAYTGRDFIGPDGEKFGFPDFGDDVTDLEMFATMYATVIMELLERDFLFKEAIYLSVIEQLEEGRSEQDVKANLELFAFQASYDIGLQENAKSQ